MNLRAIPYLRLLLSFAAGILLGEYFPVSKPEWSFGLTAGLAIPVFIFARRRYAYRFRWWFGFCFSIFLLAAGYSRKLSYDEQRQPAHFSRVFHFEKSAYLSAIVYDAPSLGKRLKTPLRVDAIADSAGNWQCCTGNIMAFIRPDSLPLNIHYGDRLVIRASIRPTSPPLNPDAFDYRRYLHFQNIHYQVFADAAEVRKVSSDHGAWFWRHAFIFRDRLLALLRHYFPGNDEYAVASALLVGYKDDLSDDLRTAYAETGSMHALAVSGTHVGFLYGGLFFLLGRLPFRGRGGYLLKAFLVLAAIWAFTLLTGGTASVLRASVMFSFFMASKAIRREASVWNILAASAFALLVVNPLLLFDAGCQLSYAAVAGMVFFYPRLYKISPALPRIPDEGIKVLLIGIAAQLGTLPLSLYYFHQFPIYFWLAGWVVVLGGAVFLWGGAVLVLLDVVFPWAAVWVGKGLYCLVLGMNSAVQGISELPGSVLNGIWLPVWAAVLLYAVMFCWAFAAVSRNTTWFLAGLALLTIQQCGIARRQYLRLNQQQTVVYYLKDGLMVDFIEGFHRTSFADSIPEKQEKFAAQAHRWASGLKKEECILRSKPGSFQLGSIRYRPPILYHQNKRILLVDQLKKISVGWPVPVDITLLAGNPEVDALECLRQFPSGQVIITATVGFRKAERWIRVCDSLRTPCHDMRTQGAFVQKNIRKP